MSSDKDFVLTATHIVAGLAPEGGGPSYSVPALVSALRRRGIFAATRFVRDEEAASCKVADPDQRVHCARKGMLGRILRSSPDLAAAIDADALGGAILHAHGLWLAPNLYPAWTKSRIGPSVKIVHSPRGMLGGAALAISPKKKKLMWRLAQRSALQAADCLHATAVSEMEEIRRAGLINPVAVIPNGIDLPDLTAIDASSGGAYTVLSLGRVHPKKGLDRLVRAWGLVEREFPLWRLRIVGPAEIRHDEVLRTLANELSIKRASVEGPVYGASKGELMRSADLFVLPTLNDNFALTVAEALALEVPVISTKGAPWSGLQTERCGWWIDHGVESLTQTLREAMTVSRAERHAMGARGRFWMARDFGWDRIAEEMNEVYRWLKQGGEAPTTVTLA